LRGLWFHTVLAIGVGRISPHQRSEIRNCLTSWLRSSHLILFWTSARDEGESSLTPRCFDSAGREMDILQANPQYLTRDFCEDNDCSLTFHEWECWKKLRGMVNVSNSDPRSVRF
jgi:hypothetical protein